MSSLFQSLDDLRSARAAAIIVEAICQDRYDQVRSLLQSIEPGETHIPLTGISPDVGAFYSDSFVIIVGSGTENWSQMIQNYTGRGQVTGPEITGQVHGAFYAQAKQVFDAIDSVVEPLLASRTLVLMGHSRGGAVCQILAGMWGSKAKNCFCYTFGCPRVGDGAFANSVGPYVIRYEYVKDSICIIPPNQVSFEERPWYDKLFHPQTGLQWAEAGQQVSLNALGDVKPDGDRASFGDFFLQAVDGQYAYHAMGWYRTCLTDNQPDPFTSAEVADPQVFNAEADSQAANETIHDALMAQRSSMPTPLCAGSFYFKSLDRTFGWTETWYATISVDAMLDAIRNLTNYRLAFLAPDCCIYWYGARVVEKGAPRASALFKRTKVAKGTAKPGGSVAADSTQMTMDCIVGRLVSSQGSKREEKWRGLPDAYLEEDGLSNAGLGALDIIQSYLLQVKAAGLGIRRQTMAEADKLAINGVSKAANGNINLDVPDHGILTTQPFEALVRGRNLANPMLRAKWNMLMKDANTLQLIGSTNFGIGSGGAGGSVTVTSYGPDSLVNPPATTRLFQFNQTSTIKTGKPSDLHAGKRSPVLRHR